VKCLYCYKELDTAQIDFHPSCSRKIFGTVEPPLLPYTEEQIEELGEQVIKSHISVTGVQPKLSLDLKNIDKKVTGKKPQRFTIVGLWGGYILKPPTKEYPNLPELEDLTMHLAELAGIATVPHTLIRLKSGNLAYLTKRIDRIKNAKLHMEDMCQLNERLTENKYKGSYEQIGKMILKYSVHPGLDLVNFFEQVVFSFLTGNADMHLKNFSLIHKPGIGYILTPAYDMTSSALVVKGDEEELALNLNGKKRKIKRKDFEIALSSFELHERAIYNIFKKFEAVRDKWIHFISKSFIPDEMKERYIALILKKFSSIEDDKGKTKRMKKYKNTSGNSGITAYETGRIG
jgi:serine/threonine-protein kinase HipA